MPAIRTEITEIVTGLAMLGYQTLDRALEIRPRHITHVDDAVFERLDQAHQQGDHDTEFALAWDNGTIFARSSNGLRGRPPWLLEWKGHHRPASQSIETIPADLRIDHVFLISCKYGSAILHNSSPTALFDHGLRPTPTQPTDWYHDVAPNQYKAVWAPTLAAAGLPTTGPPSTLDTDQRSRLKDHVRANPVDTNTSNYHEFIATVSQQSQHRWTATLRTQPARREMLWRILRMQAAPYYLLGATRRNEPLRYRIDTPWDFSQRYTLNEFTITTGQRGQPSVDWAATITNQATGTTSESGGYVEIRWSHGKLSGNPEAKVHLTTHPHDIPGYEPIT